MRRTLLGALLIATALWWSATPAAAGGWAITSLDTTPEPVAGTSLEVGFTILQHGVTPIRLDRDVGIDITTATGAAIFVPARPSSTDGHYVATVLVEQAGSTRWSIRAGWFGPHDLGEIVVQPASTVVATAAGPTPTPAPVPPAPADRPYRWPGTLRYTAIALAVVLAGLALVDARRARRPAPATS